MVQLKEKEEFHHMEVFTIFEDDLFSSVNSEVIAFVEAGTC